METSTDYTIPYRPLLMRAANSTGKLLSKVGLTPSLTLDSLLKAACRAERSTDFGDMGFAVPLQILLDSIEREAQLNCVGRFITRQRLINLLRNRLRVHALLKAHPEIAQLELPPVILITGLQRTGTTMLQRLLAQDPQHRALASWEALNPAPLYAAQEQDQRYKLRQARRAEKALSYMAPEFFAIHPVEAEAPEEDVLLLDYACISTVPESTMHVPTYARWVETHDSAPAYQYMRTLLQILSWQSPQRIWVLKSPHHLEFLDDFLTCFPNATVVMPHRDPLQTLPSFCSMMWHGRSVFSDTVHAEQVGAQWLRKTSRMLQHGVSARKRHPDIRFVDLYYTEILKDPLAQVRRIYQAYGRPLSSLALKQMKASLTVNRQHKYGVHRYHMKPFGLSPDIIYENYNAYLQQFPKARDEKIHDASQKE